MHDTVCKWNQETTDHTDSTDGNMQRGFFPIRVIRVIRAIRGEFSAKGVVSPADAVADRPEIPQVFARKVPFIRVESLVN